MVCGQSLVAGEIGATAVMIVRHGLVVAQWGDIAAKTPLASVRKSLLNALFGIAVDRRQIDLDARLGALGIDDNAPSLSAMEKTAMVRDLLEARSGVYHPALYETRRMAELRPPRFSHPPGTSARDLTRFALLYLAGGKWRDRQIVPAQWVKDTTRPYSQSGVGPGYGYLWWTGFVDNAFAPVAQLPPGSLFA